MACLRIVATVFRFLTPLFPNVKYAKICRMEIAVTLTPLEKLEIEALAVLMWEDEKKDPQEISWPDQNLGGFLKKVVTEEEFKGEIGKILVFHTHGKIKPSRILVVGLGKKEEFDLFQIRRTFAQLGKKAQELKVKTLGLSLSSTKKSRFNLKQISQGMAEGLILGTYHFSKYKKDKDKLRSLEKVEVAAEVALDLVAIKDGITKGEIYSSATTFARDLVNEPASVTTPSYLADVARKLAGPDIKSRIFDKVQMAKMGLGGILGVAQGSEEPPKLIRLEYKPRGARQKVVLVGKTVTFDSGGLSLKRSEAMQTMKMDMAGGAAILGIFSVLPKIKPRVWVIGLIPATENMPSGKALKPGDILRSYNGKTIEVVDTDAEGRIILADALSLGAEEKPRLLLDLATLTGACMVALGEEVAGLFGEDMEITEKVQKAAQEMGEFVWPLPLVKEYQEQIKSEIADVKNVSKSKYGGAITAALFLKEFVQETPWIHMDIAGPAFAEKETTPFVPVGGSGFGVRTVLNLLENL